MKHVGWIRAVWQTAAMLAALLSAAQRLYAQEGAIAGTAVISGSQRTLSGVQTPLRSSRCRGCFRA